MSRQQKPAMESRLAGRLREKKALLDRYRPLPAGTVARLHEDLKVLSTYHSNAIEGNTLSLHETQMVVEYGMTVGGTRCGSTRRRPTMLAPTSMSLP